MIVTSNLKVGTATHKPKGRTLTPLVIGIYGAGPTGQGYSNADVKTIADAAGGTMYDGPGNLSWSSLWQDWWEPIFEAIEARYVKSDTAGSPPEKLILFGYSMGGLGAVIIANGMAGMEKFKHIKVALAGIDPVRLVNRSPAELPDNVVAWVNYYQQDESRQGIVDFKKDLRHPVDVDLNRISGGPFAPGKKTGPGANYKLTTKSEGQTVNHVTMPTLPKVRSGVLGFISKHL
jgi:hypothetical protein